MTDYVSQSLSLSCHVMSLDYIYNIVYIQRGRGRGLQVGQGRGVRVGVRGWGGDKNFGIASGHYISVFAFKNNKKLFRKTKTYKV